MTAPGFHRIRILCARLLPGPFGGGARYQPEGWGLLHGRQRDYNLAVDSLAQDQPREGIGRPAPHIARARWLAAPAQAGCVPLEDRIRIAVIAALIAAEPLLPPA